MKLYKDYEYGFYGFHGSYDGLFFNSQGYHNYNHSDGRTKPVNVYELTYNNTLKQIKQLKDVKFISGCYSEVI